MAGGWPRTFTTSATRGSWKSMACGSEEFPAFSRYLKLTEVFSNDAEPEPVERQLFAGAGAELF
jgi:hypothetical protein